MRQMFFYRADPNDQRGTYIRIDAYVVFICENSAHVDERRYEDEARVFLRSYLGSNSYLEKQCEFGWSLSIDVRDKDHGEVIGPKSVFKARLPSAHRTTTIYP